MLFYVVVCVCVWCSVHNGLEPDWWLAGRWGRHVRQRQGEEGGVHNLVSIQRGNGNVLTGFVMDTMYTIAHSTTSQHLSLTYVVLAQISSF